MASAGNWRSEAAPGLYPQHPLPEQHLQHSLQPSPSNCTTEDPASQCPEAELQSYGPGMALDFCNDGPGKLHPTHPAS